MRRPNINLGASETLKDGTNSVGTAAGLAPLPFRPHGRVFRILCVKRHCSCSLALVNNVSVCTVLANWRITKLKLLWSWHSWKYSVEYTSTHSLVMICLFIEPQHHPMNPHFHCLMSCQLDLYLNDPYLLPGHFRRQLNTFMFCQAYGPRYHDCWRHGSVVRT